MLLLGILTSGSKYSGTVKLSQGETGTLVGSRCLMVEMREKYWLLDSLMDVRKVNNEEIYHNK